MGMISFLRPKKMQPENIIKAQEAVKSPEPVITPEVKPIEKVAEPVEKVEETPTRRRRRQSTSE